MECEFKGLFFKWINFVFSRSQRTDWRTERKLNSETFGVASARRGGFRGRGYYGGRGYNRPQGGFRPRGPPRNDRNSGQVDNKPQNAAEDTSSSQKSVPVQGGRHQIILGLINHK